MKNVKRKRIKLTVRVKKVKLPVSLGAVVAAQPPPYSVPSQVGLPCPVQMEVIVWRPMIGWVPLQAPPPQARWLGCQSVDSSTLPRMYCFTNC
jgi:hypothetical protein